MFRNVIAALLSIGTLSTPALAQPMQRDWHRNDSYGQRYDQRYDGRYNRGPRQARRVMREPRRGIQWFELAAPQPMNTDFRTPIRRAQVVMDPGAPRVSELRIDPLYEGVYVNELAVQLVSGETMKVFPQAHVEGGALIFDLGRPKAVKRVIVYGRDSDRGRFDGFTVSAR